MGRPMRPRGNTEIQIFATGAGLSSPPEATSSIVGVAGNSPELPAKITIGGMDAQVAYAGAAPGEAAGVLQVNVLVPTDAPTGPAVPLTLTVGDIVSPGVTTIAVR